MIGGVAAIHQAQHKKLMVTAPMQQVTQQVVRPPIINLTARKHTQPKKTNESLTHL